MDNTVAVEHERESGHDSHKGLDTKTDRLTDRQSPVFVVTAPASSSTPTIEAVSFSETTANIYRNMMTCVLKVHDNALAT
jgi:hypothetical protein